MEKIAVIGIGKLGLCLALQFESAGYYVMGVETNRDHIQAINDRRFNSSEPGVNELMRDSKLVVVEEINQIKEFEPSMILVAVATPSLPTGGYDHNAIDKVLDDLFLTGKAFKRTEVVICCTTLPGYCDTRAKEALEKNYAISYKPEFIAQGSINRDLQYPDQVLIGEADAEAGDKIQRLYSSIHKNDPKVCRMNRLSAEITKLATNCFLTMKIAFANSIGDLCEQTGAETEKILQAIGSDSRIGNKFLQYGFGFGGPCFPRDNRALEYFGKQYQHDLLLSKATDESNTLHLEFQFQQYMCGNANGNPIHFYSLTYKPGSRILEESQQLALAVKLAKAGKKIVIHESDEVIAEVQSRYGNIFEYAKNDG